MRLGLNEIMSVIDKVKSTGLTAFEYQDADVRLKIGNKNAGNAGTVCGTADPGIYGAKPGTENTGLPYGITSDMVNPGAAYGAEQSEKNLSGVSYGTGRTMASQAIPYAVSQDTAGQGAPYMAAQNAADSEMPQEASEVPQEGKYVFIESPMVGTFYAAASEKAEPFVKVGDTIKIGQTVGIVEAMKLMNEIEAECSGTVDEILAENGQMVEYGQPLMRVRTDV